MAKISVEALPLSEPIYGNSVYPDGPILEINFSDFNVIPSDYQDDIVVFIFNTASWPISVRFRQKYLTNGVDFGAWETIPDGPSGIEITIPPGPSASNFVGFELYGADSDWVDLVITSISANLGMVSFWGNNNKQTESP